MREERRVRSLVYRVAAGAVLALAACFALGPTPTEADWKAAAFFAVFGLLASVLGYRSSSGASGHIGFLPYLSAATLAPNLAALLAVLCSTALGELLIKRPPIKGLFNTSQLVLAQAIALTVLWLAGGQQLSGRATPLIPFVLMCATFMVTNKLAVSTVVAVSTGQSIRAHWLQSMRGSIVYDLLALPLVLFFVYAYSEFGPAWSAGLALPMLGLRQLYKTNFALQKVNEELLQLMVAAIEARDPYTSGHSQRVARYAKVVARAAGVSGRRLEQVVMAALLHDVGKIHEEFAPLLRKAGKLTEAEFDLIKSHSARGAALVSKVSHFEALVPMIRGHHESWNGAGYPDRLAGASIPWGARVIAIADTIDAMTSSRPYRASLPNDALREELRLQAGRQFDPMMATAVVDEPFWAEVCAEIVLANAEFPSLMHESGPSVTAQYPVQSFR